MYTCFSHEGHEQTAQTIKTYVSPELYAPEFSNMFKLPAATEPQWSKMKTLGSKGHEPDPTTSSYTATQKF